VGTSTYQVSVVTDLRLNLCLKGPLQCLTKMGLYYGYHLKSCLEDVLVFPVEPDD